MMHHFAVQDLGAVENQEWRIDGIIGDSTNKTVPSMFVKRAAVPSGFHRYGIVLTEKQCVALDKNMEREEERYREEAEGIVLTSLLIAHLC